MACGAAIHSIESPPKVATGRAFIRQLIFIGVPRGEVPGHRYIQLLLIRQGMAKFETARNQYIRNVARQNRVGELCDTEISGTVELFPSDELERSREYLALVSKSAQKYI